MQFAVNDGFRLGYRTFGSYKAPALTVPSSQLVVVEGMGYAISVAAAGPVAHAVYMFLLSLNQE
jgi:hypothetical protein